MTQRLVGIDLARWCALLGMMGTHLLALRDEATGDPTWVAEVLSGRASALFAVLAGVSLALLTGGPRPVRSADRVVRSAGLVVRALAVGVAGLLLGQVESGLAVILVNYALLFLLGLLVVGWSAPALAALAVALAFLAPVLLWWIRPELPPRGFESPSLASLEEPGHLLAELVVTGYYPVLVWTAYLLVGMALGRLDLRTVSARTLVVVGAVAAATAAAAELVSDRLLARDGMVRILDRDQWRLAGRDDAEALDRLRHVIDTGMFGQTPVDGAWQWLLVSAPHSSTPPDLLRTGGAAVAAVVACLLLLRALGPRAARGAAVLAGAGAATLSLYTLHVLMTSEVLPPADDDRGAVVQVGVVVGTGAVLALLRWRGPLEALVSRAARLVERSV